MDSSFILTVFKNHSDVKKSIKKTSIKYNCFATSKSYICFGASTGSTYVYGRSNGELLRFFGNKVHGIVGLCFSPDEKYITAADRTGNVTCWEITSQNYDFKIIKEFIEFDGTTITSMCWDEYSSKLFVGNSKGLIMGFAVGFAAFHKLEVIRKAGDPIVQMDVCNGKLVVSSTTKAILCLLERSQFCQIGTKPRDGLYGTCFLKARPENQPVIYSARPGSRLWEVDFNGQVLATHQFKESLSTPPTPLVTSRELKFHPSNTVWNSPQGFNFPKLCPLMNRYLVTWSSLGIYMIDPSIGSIVAWNDQIKDILDVCCTQNSIYVLHHNGALTEIVLMDVKECLLELRKLEEWMKIAEVSLQQEEGILKSVEQFLSIGFDDVLQRLKEDEQANTEKSDVITEFEEFIQRVEKCHIEVRTLVQERLNQLKLNASDENVRPPDDQDESGDEVRSTVTSLSGISETSSKISLTRLADMKDNLVQKAANAMVSKVMKTGFMKKAFRDALESEGVIIDNKEQHPTTRPSTLHMEVLRTKSTPNSPRVFKKPASIQRHNSDQLLKTEASTPADPRQRFLARKTVSTPALNLDESEQTKSTEADSNFTGAESSDSTTMGSTPTSFQQSTMASDSDSLVIRKKARKPKKKRKAKMVELTMAEEPQDDPLPTEYSTQKTDNLMDQDLPPFFVENILKDRTSSLISTTDQPIPNTIQNESGSDRRFSSTQPQLPFEETDHVGARQPLASLQLQLPPNASEIVNKLVTATYTTRNDFRDAGVLYNPKSFLEKLKSWAKCLSEATKSFREECFRLLDSNIQREMNNTILAYLDVQCNDLFFQQSHSAFSEICNLAMLCFETNTFPKKCSMLKAHEISLLNTELSLDVIMENAEEEMQRILTAESKNSPVVEKVEKDPPSLEKDTEKVTVPDLLQDIKNIKDVGELLDRKSLSTIASVDSGSKSSNSTCDILRESIDILIENTAMCENYDLTEGESCEWCLIDKCRACFVLRYFPIINFARIRVILSSTKKCRWRTWLAYVITLKYTHRNSTLAKLIESNSPDSNILEEVVNTDLKHFLAVISKLYNRSLNLLLDCITCKDLGQWEIIILMYSGILGNDESKHEEYLAYFQQKLEIKDLKLEHIFTRLVVESALQYHPGNALLFCGSSGKARPGSSTLEWRWGGLLKDLVENLHKSPTKCEEHVDIIAKLCFKHGYWHGYVTLATINQSLYQLICQLADTRLLDYFINTRNIDLGEDGCSAMLNHFAARFDQSSDVFEGSTESHACSPLDGWSPTLTLERVIQLTAAYCGSRYTLNCLKESTPSTWSDSLREIFVSLLKAVELESKEELIISSLIEEASAQVWNEPRNYLPHEFQLVKKLEFDDGEISANQIDSLYPNEYVQDDTEAVWGRSIDISNGECPVCTLPLHLKTTYTSASAGLIVFQCGHSFHKICVPEDACLVCYHENFSTII